MYSILMWRSILKGCEGCTVAEEFSNIKERQNSRESSDYFVFPKMSLIICTSISKDDFSYFLFFKCITSALMTSTSFSFNPATLIEDVASTPNK